MAFIEQLLTDNMEWAASIARLVSRRLPPSFDVADLVQEAHIALWHACEKFDEATGVPFRAFARQPIMGAVLMSARRRHYKASTMDELPAALFDSRPDPEAARIAAEKQGEADALMSALTEVIGNMGYGEQYVLKRAFLDGEDIDVLAEVWGIDAKLLKRKVAVAVRSLRARRGEVGELKAIEGRRIPAVAKRERKAA
jgi:RNA polymerase sigma factor (sigma-70 family)